MGQKLLCAVSILVLIFSANTANAVEPLSAIALASHCKVLPEQTDNIDGQFCIRYIQGIIDDASATDERVLLNVEAEFEKQETYAERATRVRGFGDLKASKLVADSMARTVVYASLRKHYPCKSSY